MSAPKKHHYLPAFYLRRWIRDDDKRLCEFSRPYGGMVVPQRRYPEATGFVPLLYETPGVPPEEAQRVEEKFMKPLDTLASDALEMLENDDPRMCTDPKYRSAWSRFLMSLCMRTPEDIATVKRGVSTEWVRSIKELQARYDAEKGPDTAPNVEQYLALNDPDASVRLAMTLAMKLMDHQKIGELINNMRWLVVRIDSQAGEFLTSDRPVLMTTLLSEENAFLMLPIGPKMLFVAAKDIETQMRIVARDPAERVKVTNRYVVAHAANMVYAREDSVLEYVRQYMSTEPRTSLFERMVSFRGSNAG